MNKKEKKMKDKIKFEINKMGKGQKVYETKKGIKKGYPNLEKWIESKIITSEKNNKIIQFESKLDNERKFWKKTQGDIYPEIRGTPSANLPVFDMDYWTKRNPDFIEGVSTLTSYEMLEYFLTSANIQYSASTNSNGNIKVTSHKNHDDLIKHKKYLITQYWYCMSNLIPTHKYKEDLHNLGSNKLEPFKWFNQLEHIIKDNELFWILIEKVWTFGSHLLNQKEMFSRYGRTKLTIEKRLELLNEDNVLLNNVTGELSSRKNDTLKTEDFYTTFLDNQSDDELIPIYRSFKVKKGDKIRKSNIKGDADYYVHNAGSSWSYSLDKTIAIKLGWCINEHHFKKYLGMDNSKKIKKHMLRKDFLLEPQLLNPTFSDGYYTVLGLFGVYKQDIIMMTDSRRENEVVIDPNNVKLLDYRFLNFIDFANSKSVHALLYGMSRLNEDEINFDEDYENTIHESSIVNIDRIYDTNYTITEKVFKQNPELRKELLENGFKHKTLQKYQILRNNIKHPLYDCTGYGIHRYASKNDKTDHHYISIKGKDNNYYDFGSNYPYSIRQRKCNKLVKISVSENGEIMGGF